MADLVLDRIGRLGRFLWSGWVGVAGMAVFCAIWQQGHEAYGDFILPSPIATAHATLELVRAPETWRLAWATSSRAVEGFFLVAVLGGAMGLAVGYSAAAMRLARPLLTIIMGVPPIA